MHRLAPAARIRLVEATARLQKLRREMACLSKGDKDYEKKKLALQAVIRELQPGRHASGESKTRKATSAEALTQLSHEGRQASSRSRAKKFLSS